jgi:S-adenosylmethionine decarboxylase
MARRKTNLAAIAGGRALEPKTPVLKAVAPEAADHFITREGVTFAGSHLIVDFWEAEGLDDLARIEQAMKDAVTEAGATLLHIHLHHFTPNGGVSGVAVLAESHISVHTWPERGYAAFDVFMCGNAEPRKAAAVLERAFAPKRVVLGIHKRGVL